MATEPVNQKTAPLSVMSSTATATAASVARRISLSCDCACSCVVCSTLAMPDSGIETFRAPGGGWRIAIENEPVMQAERPIAPELDADGHDAEARPMRRARHLAKTEFGGINRNLPFELEACFELAGLSGCPCADLAVAGT